MKILFFVDEGFSKSCLEYISKKKVEMGLNFILYIIRRGGVELVVITVKDDVTHKQLMRLLNVCGVDYVYEMEGGAPRVLRYVRTNTGMSIVETEF